MFFLYIVTVISKIVVSQSIIIGTYPVGEKWRDKFSVSAALQAILLIDTIISKITGVPLQGLGCRIVTAPLTFLGILFYTLLVIFKFFIGSPKKML